MGSRTKAALIPENGSRRIVIATIGSLGDLHPCLALAVELQQRGHRVTVTSTEFYRDIVEQLGVEFQPMRPNWDPNDRALISQCEDLKRGPEVLFRQLILPHLTATYDDLVSVATGADLLIAGELVYAAPLVAEKIGLRWVSVILSPCSFFSSHDPSVLVNVPSLIQLRRLGTPIYRAALDIARLATQHWWKPVRHLRRDLGLRSNCDPLFRDKFSPDLVLALFSRWLAQSQPDWPPQTVQSGFVYFDRQKAGCDYSPELAAFLNSGDPPIVFTLGSTAVNNPGDFYQASVKAARKLGRRAVLLGASATPAVSPSSLLLPYAAYSQIFPHAAAIVHQGGSGTTGQALRAGRPMLIVPYGWDQPDNGARVEHLGAGLCLSRTTYSAETAAAALERLLRDARFAARAAEVGKQLQKENALTLSCDAIEAVG
jgi:UDP:flavonoid glycosyltransferase YjiC (YdhE family)